MWQWIPTIVGGLFGIFRDKVQHSSEMKKLEKEAEVAIKKADKELAVAVQTGKVDKEVLEARKQLEAVRPENNSVVLKVFLTLVFLSPYLLIAIIPDQVTNYFDLITTHIPEEYTYFTIGMVGSFFGIPAARKMFKR